MKQFFLLILLTVLNSYIRIDANASKTYGESITIKTIFISTPPRPSNPRCPSRPPIAFYNEHTITVNCPCKKIEIKTLRGSIYTENVNTIYIPSQIFGECQLFITTENGNQYMGTFIL